MKVNLRKITLDDTYKIVNWRNQDFVLENFIDRRLISIESHNKYFEKRIISGLVDQFIIVCDGKDIGSTFLRDIDYVKKQAEFGIFIGEKEYLSKGIGTIACSLILEYGFNILGLEKIFLRVLKNNTRAQKSYLKSGFIIDDSIGNEEEKTNELFMSKRRF